MSQTDKNKEVDRGQEIVEEDVHNHLRVLHQVQVLLQVPLHHQVNLILQHRKEEIQRRMAKKKSKGYHCKNN